MLLADSGVHPLTACLIARRAAGGILVPDEHRDQEDLGIKLRMATGGQVEAD